MILRLLADSYVGLILGNIWGFFDDLRPKKPIIWESDYFYKQVVGANPRLSLGFGAFFCLFSLPWFTFIPYDFLARAMASFFLSLGYWIFKGYPTNFTKMYLTADSVEIKTFKHTIVSMSSQDILAVIKSDTSYISHDLLYKQGNKIRLLSSSGVHFALPLDIFGKRWGIPIIEAGQVGLIWEKNSTHSFFEKLLAYSTMLLNPVTGMIVYIIFFGPFKSIFWGLAVLELVSIFYGFVNNYFARGYSKKLTATTPNNQIPS